MTELKKICMVSIDVEEEPPSGGNKTFSGVENLDRILEVFKTFDIKATLFVTGEVLEAYPRRIEGWAKEHEVACHGYYHVPLPELSQPEREKELEDYNRLYEKILGSKPLGFRGPRNTIDNQQMELLQELGYGYDCSVIPSYPPFKRYIGYNDKAPKELYHPAYEDYHKKGDMSILEIPVTPLIFGFPLFGTWLRILGLGFYHLLLSLNRPEFVSLAIHSWDGVQYEGTHSRNSGAKFLKLLQELLETLRESYTFSNGVELYKGKIRCEEG